MQIKFSKSNVFTVKLLGESRGGRGRFGGGQGLRVKFCVGMWYLNPPPPPTTPLSFKHQLKENLHSNIKNINNVKIVNLNLYL